jgi:hypothetical protein
VSAYFLVPSVRGVRKRGGLPCVRAAMAPGAPWRLGGAKRGEASSAKGKPVPVSLITMAIDRCNCNCAED